MNIKYLCVHHSAVSRKVQKYQFDAINRYHKIQFNMKSSLGIWIGYNVLIEPTGELYVCRADGEETAAVVKHNLDSLHACLVGDFNSEYPTQAQVNKLKSWLFTKMKLFGLEADRIKNHRDLQKYRTCPGVLIPDNWGQTLVSPSALQPLEQQKKDGLLKELKRTKPVGILG
mgnify:CR=1 FL=1